MKKKRILLSSCLVILLFVSIIVGITYSFFTDSFSVRNHLNAGNLKIGLQRVNLEYNVLNSDGDFAVTKVSDVVDFTNSTNENVFGIDSNDIKIVPGSYFDATMRITNEGNVAFTYSVGIEIIGKINELSKQLQVAVTHPDGMVTIAKLSELSAGLSIAAGTMAANGSTQDFSIKIECIDAIDNNSAQSQTAVFDLIVTAVQVTAQN